jgi:RNA polymerase sigma factor (TIGR02999 family)
MPGQADITQLLKRWKDGDASAEAELAPIVYDELHKLAQAYMRHEKPGDTLQPTALVNELYMKLVAGELPDVNSRTHFYGIAAHRMRQILVDEARRHRAEKRGGGVANVELNELLAGAVARGETLMALDSALNELGKFDERKTKIIELRYFGGLDQEEIGLALGISPATIRREQRKAEIWLRSFMSGVRSGPSAAVQDHHEGP